MIALKKLLYMFGVLVALIAVLTAGAIAFLGAKNGAWASVVVAIAVALAGVAFIWFAHGRTNALEAERHEHERSESAAVLDAALARRVTDSRFVARRKLLWLAVAIALAAMFVGGAMLTWSAGAYVPAGLLTLLAGMMMWFLLPALANREAIVVDVRGIGLPGRYDVIPWKAIYEAYFSTYELRGARVAEARLGVRDSARYRRSRWALSLGTGSGDQVVVPLRGLDQTPETIFAAIRQFHERAAPRGALVGTGASYRVDPRAARLEAIHKRMLEVGEEMKRVAADMERRSPIEDDSPQMKAFEKNSECRIREMEALGAEASSLISEQGREIESRMALARRSLKRLRWLTYAFLAVVVVYGLIRILAR